MIFASLDLLGMYVDHKIKRELLETVANIAYAFIEGVDLNQINLEELIDGFTDHLGNQLEQ